MKFLLIIVLLITLNIEGIHTLDSDIEIKDKQVLENGLLPLPKLGEEITENGLVPLPKDPIPAPDPMEKENIFNKSNKQDSK